MRLELNRIAPIRAANVTAVLYFIMGAAFMLFFLSLSGLVPSNPQLDPHQQQVFRSTFRSLAIAYPFLGAAMGWIFGLCASAAYNLVSPRLGGYRVEFRAVDVTPNESAA